MRTNSSATISRVFRCRLCAIPFLIARTIQMKLIVVSSVSRNKKHFIKSINLRFDRFNIDDNNNNNINDNKTIIIITITIMMMQK